MSNIPAPYDNTSGQRTMAQAMQELREFRNSRKPHNLSVLPFRGHNEPIEQEQEQEQVETKSVKKSKRRQVESEE